MVTTECGAKNLDIHSNIGRSRKAPRMEILKCSISYYCYLFFSIAITLRY